MYNARIHKYTCNIFPLPLSWTSARRYAYLLCVYVCVCVGRTRVIIVWGRGPAGTKRVPKTTINKSSSGATRRFRTGEDTPVTYCPNGRFSSCLVFESKRFSPRGGNENQFPFVKTARPSFTWSVGVREKSRLIRRIRRQRPYLTKPNRRPARPRRGKCTRTRFNRVFAKTVVQGRS